MLKYGIIFIDYVNSEVNLANFLNKPSERKLILETSNEMDLSQLEISSDGNPTFVIEDPMKKVHMGNNKSLDNPASTDKIVLPMM